MILVFLSSGLLLGWFLGANGTANIFGSAISSKMVKSRKAIVAFCVFVILGAILQGNGPSETLIKLGKVNAVGGAFIIVLATVITVLLMTRYKLSASSSQAIVGAIVGWNLYTGVSTSYSSLIKIILTWILCPVLAAIFAVLLYLLVRFIINKSKIHLLKLDKYLRIGLLLVGAFGAFSLGANNIANIMSVFVTTIAPQKVLNLGFITLSGTQQLFLLGGCAIAVGAITYSKKTIKTVGNNILELSSESALVVILAHSLVLFIFSSEQLRDFILSLGLLEIPLVPISSSQAIIGAILGVGLLKQAREIKFNAIGGVAISWLTTPVIAGMLSFASLFFINTVLNLEVIKSDPKTKISTQLIDNNKKASDTIHILHKITENQIIKNQLNENKIEHDEDSVRLTKNFLLIFGSISGVVLVIIVLLYYKIKSKEGLELQQKITQIEQSQKAYIESELENTKILNESLEAEIEFRKRELTTLALNMINKNEFLANIKKQLLEIKSSKNIDKKDKLLNNLLEHINQSMNVDKERKTFYSNIEEVDNDFFLKLDQNFQNLTHKDKQLAALLRLNLSSKDIAHLQNISPKSVEMNRYRLRQKMNLETGESLTEFINKI